MKSISMKWLALGVAAGLVPQLLPAQTDANNSQGSSSQAQPAQPQTSTSSSSRQSGQAVRASKIMGADLKTSNGEDLGEIRDLIVDPKTGKINFAIIGVTTGQGTEALAPIPWKAVNLQSEKNYVASIDKNKLRSGPTLTQDQWDRLMQPDYVVEVYRFYGLEPGGEAGGAQTPGGASSGAGQQEPSSQGPSQGQ